MYRAATESTVWVTVGDTACSLESSAHVDAYGGLSQVTIVPAHTDLVTERRNVGTCKCGLRLDDAQRARIVTCNVLADDSA
jgi:hypothetical protein